MAISHEGYGSGSIEKHPRAYHNLIKVTTIYAHVSSRKSAETWVGEKMKPQDMLLLFARHGIEHPPTKQLEDKLRMQCLQQDAEGEAASLFIAQVEGERAKYESYLLDMKRADDSRDKIIRERTASIVGGLTFENAAPEEVLRRWGFVGPVSETPILPLSIPAPVTSSSHPDFSIRKKMKAQQKAYKKAEKLAAKRAKVNPEKDGEASDKIFDDDVLEDIIDVDTAVTVAEPPLALEMVPSPRVPRRYVDLGEEDDEDVDTRREDPVPSVAEDAGNKGKEQVPLSTEKANDEDAEEEGALQHREKRRRTQAGEASRTSGVSGSGGRVFGQDQFSPEDSVLDLDVAARLGKYILLPKDLGSFEGAGIDEILSYITAHALSVNTSFRQLFHMFSFL